VTGYLFKDRDGQTPLTLEQQKGLIPKNLQTMGELDEHEEANIAEGLAWLPKATGNHRTYAFWLTLHKRLFGQVWRWAGSVRKEELANPEFKLPHEIWPEIGNLEKELGYWLKEKPFKDEEIAARLHQRLLTIHPFPNGNGRWSRILTEHICNKEDLPIPSWGVKHREDPKLRRDLYIKSVQKARSGDHSALQKFMYE
tara:strand:- start:4762 stop:5355 length:594 start_codon:yes stop_codon:yes gene_type:complete